ncbi:hypothetical protein AAMO2058_000858900 [Amorphochlora amoebiformis]|uniref:Cilia- and flagella-associated protein 157 n=1 Tax=Amorphochlora amoebiformis TaxID=1561963 RepID=A0A7S0H5T8_9EUKA|mmetsp:Transcript_6318/g.9702  ORF Transcript_6318/g.9702 Transcript_6318/m.9702 type:complete len:431 (+) Transcript_6318:82-1374(+)
MPKTTRKKKKKKQKVNYEELYQLQCAHDRDRMEMLSQNFSTAKKAKNELEGSIVSLERKNQELAQTLRKEIAEERELTLSLKQTNTELKTENEELIEDYETKIRDLQKKHRQERGEAKFEYTKLNNLFKKISHFIKNMDKTEKELKDKDNEIKRLERNQNLITLELETRHLESTEALKARMKALFEEAKDGLLAMTENQLHSTTKKTIEENENLSNELNFQTRETENIIKENLRLKKANQECKRKIEILKEEQDMLIKRSTFYQKMNKRLKTRLKEVTGHQTDQISTMKDPGVTVDKYQALLEEMEILQNHVAKLEDAYDASQKELMEVTKELKTTRNASESILSLQDDIKTFLLTCIQDSKNLLAERKRGVPKRLSELKLQDREAIISILYQKLVGGGGTIIFSPTKKKNQPEFPPIVMNGKRNPNLTT